MAKSDCGKEPISYFYKKEHLENYERIFGKRCCRCKAKLPKDSNSCEACNAKEEV